MLRNLQAFIDELDDYWAWQLQALLKNINKVVKRAKAQGKDVFSASNCPHYRQRYMTWVQQGLKRHPAIKGNSPKGPPKQTKN